MNKTEAKQFVRRLAAAGNQRAAARELGVAQSAVSYRLGQARNILGTDAVEKLLRPHGGGAAVAARASLSRTSGVPRTSPAGATATATRASLADAVTNGDRMAMAMKLLQDENRRLRKQAETLAESALNEEQIRRQIFEIAHAKPTTPAWIERSAAAGATTTGVPILFGSDWHWGEVVKPSEIGGVNEYNLTIARERLNKLIERTINLLTRHMVKPDYPGIVFALGGDMVSGNIHEELSETNEEPIMTVVLDLVDHLIVAIKRLKAVFGRVFLPCVAGNHGRMHKKMRAKESNFNSFDWLIYQCLDRHFQDDPDVVFFIPDGPDALVSVYGYRYLFTHGNQFRGGDGMIGPLGPITRGDHKKRSRNAQINQEYDTLVIGHFHQLLQMRRIIMNGSLIGYNEYAHANNFGFEQPQQALWISHPDHGITFSMPVHLGAKAKGADKPWVSFHEASKFAS
ncbi:LysR family transcriptional regulator [Burkholderia ambifaria]|uniref:LysR family transcriptional regulator n=1 Tax=Burkholderia ambifaria TaxID=152480 RepID=UPI0013E0C667|nr:LysR family transcriptional regulator [Burkholderia ambifaria]